MRTLSDNQKAQMLNELAKSTPITVVAPLGDGEAILFAQEIHAFLQSNGFTMKEPGGISQSVFSGVVKGLQMRNEPNGEITLIVGAA